MKVVVSGYVVIILGSGILESVAAWSGVVSRAVFVSWRSIRYFFPRLI